MATHPIRRFNPLQTGKVMGLLFGLIDVVFVSMLFLSTLVFSKEAGSKLGGWGVGK